MPLSTRICQRSLNVNLFFLISSARRRNHYTEGLRYSYNSKGLLISQKALSKADDGTRTRDLLITNEVRYHLCHISLFAGLYFARHALLYYFPNVLSTPFLSFFIFIKKDINLALRLYKELNCVKIHTICSCCFNSQSVFSRSLTCRK